MVDKALFTSNSEMWETPQDLFDDLNKKYKFNVDVCAIKENAKCDNFITPEMNGLTEHWSQYGTCWMNPPYGRGIDKWIEKASIEAENGATVVALLPARTDTKWFHNYIYNNENATITFIKGRLKFSNSKNSAPFPSMIVEFKKKKKSLINKLLNG